MSGPPLLMLGDWHTLVLFRSRVGRALEFGPPEPLLLDHPALQEAARVLGITIGGPARQV